MVDECKNSKKNSDNLTSDVTFWDLYPTNLSSVSDVNVQSLPFSVRVINRLMQTGIKTVADLYRMKVDDFVKLRGAGAKCYREVCEYFESVSNDTTEVAVSVQERLFEDCFPKIIAENIENILNQDFSFSNELDDASEEWAAVEKYKNAIEILGVDLARDCYYAPHKIRSIKWALDPWIKNYRERESRKSKLNEHLEAVPALRRETKAYGYINAFTTDEEQRAVLYNIYALSDHPDACVKSFIFEKVAESVTNFALLLGFLKWCAFDINEEIAELFQMLYAKSENIKIVLQGRANGKTLGVVGERLGITRERVRQLEAKAKRIFHNWQSRTHILLKISAERNGDPVLSASELSEYFGDKYIEMVFLLRSFESSAYYYDSQLDVFVVGDESTSAVIEQIIESLPDAFDDRKYISVITECVEEQGVPKELIEKAIDDEFQKDGSTYHRTRLSLTTIYTKILDNYYQEGIDIYSEEELRVFRHIAVSEYGCQKLPENNRAICARLSDIGILCGKGKYRPKKKSYISKELAERIHKFIIDSPSVIFMTNTLFSVFEEELLGFGIDNKYYLQGVLRELYNSEFVFRRDYISKDESVTSLHVDIVRFIKGFSYPVAKEDIKNAFPGVTEIVITVATEDADIINLFGKYIHGSKLNISDSDKVYFDNILQRFIAGNRIRHYGELYDYINQDDPDLLQRLFIHFPTSLFSVLEYLFKGRYQFKRPFIANLGVDIGDPEEQLREFVINSDEIMVSEIIAFGKANHYVTDSILEMLNSFNNTHLFVDKKTLVTIDRIGLDDNIAKEAISILQKEVTETELISSFEYIHELPKINYPWTDWLIYSVINKWGKDLIVGTTSNQFRQAVPLMAPYGKLDVQKYKGVASTSMMSTIRKIDNLDEIDDLIGDILFEEYEW